MASSLFTALSGLKAHESWISVIGNNLANANTNGFKSSRATFSDQFSQNLRFASLPNGSLGGRNPMQLGLGVQLSDIGRDFAQGALDNTGRPFDLAINGSGLFMVSDGINTLYTRVGTFGMDAASHLVDLRTGYNVLGISGQPIDIDSTSLFPPSATTQIGFAGNLPATVTGPLAQIMTTAGPFEEGVSAALLGASGTPDNFVVPVGQTYTMDLIINGAAPLTVNLPGQAAPYTAQDVVNIINGLPNSGVTAADVGGQVQLSTDKTGSGTSILVVPGPSATNAAALLGLSTALVSGSSNAATLSTDLNLLPTNNVDYAVGDSIDISGLDHDGTPVQATFVYGVDGTTVGDLVSFIDSSFTNASASFDAASGTISLTSDQTGLSDLSLTINDLSGTGSTDWAQHAFLATTVGKGPDLASTSIEVFDAAGTAHTLTLEFERQDDGSWNISASTPDGTVSGTVQGLRFNQNGAIAVLPVNSSFSVHFDGQNPQTVQLDLGTPGKYDGVTQFGQGPTAFADAQDGYGVGELTNISVNGDGDILGFYSNGQIQSLGEIGVATFVNDNGLREVGNNLWAETANSGVRTVSKGAQGKAGEVIGGALEASNVEVAEEFVHLIEAQRGFQANSRVITTTNQVLADLVNLI